MVAVWIVMCNIIISHSPSQRGGQQRVLVFVIISMVSCLVF